MTVAPKLPRLVLTHSESTKSNVDQVSRSWWLGFGFEPLLLVEDLHQKPPPQDHQTTGLRLQTTSFGEADRGSAAFFPPPGRRHAPEPDDGVSSRRRIDRTEQKAMGRLGGVLLDQIKVPH